MKMGEMTDLSLKKIILLEPTAEKILEFYNELEIWKGNKGNKLHNKVFFCLFSLLQFELPISFAGKRLPLHKVCCM